MADVETLSEAIDSREAAEILGKSTKTVSIYVRDGLLTPVYRGRGVRGIMLFRRVDVTALADAITDTRTS